MSLSGNEVDNKYTPYTFLLQFLTKEQLLYLYNWGLCELLLTHLNPCITIFLGSILWVSWPFLVDLKKFSSGEPCQWSQCYGQEMLSQYWRMSLESCY